MTCPTFRVLLPVLLLLTACVTETVDEPIPTDPLRQAATASIGGSTPIPTPANFSWLRSSAVLVDDPRLDAQHAEALVRAALQEGLATHGLAPGSRATARLQVGYVVALEGPMDDSAVSRVFGIDPGLTAPTEDAAQYDKGTMIVSISLSGARTPLWRGSVQVFADLDLPEKLRQARLRRAVTLLLSRAPFAHGDG